MDKINNKKIGVIDSGVGALTVTKEIQKQLPNESIIYYGDNGNVPYGNKSEKEIYILAKNMIDFLIEKDVKLIAVACNTTSALLDKYFLDYPIPIISIIDPVSEYISKREIDEVGVIATNFTIQSKEYNKKINKMTKGKTKVISEGSATLATIIDSGEFTSNEINAIISEHIANIKLKSPNLENIILGCTHYPIVMDIFKSIDKSINYINPAEEQVKYIKNLLKRKNKLSKSKDSTFNLYTTGNAEIYKNMINLMDMKKPDKIFELDVK